MNRTTCIWFGFLDGAAVGLVLAALRIDAPFLPAGPLPLALDGLVVAAMMAVVEILLGRLLTQRPWLEVIALALAIAIPAGLVFGPLGFYIAVPLAALLVCAGCGVVLGLAVCRLICGGRRNVPDGAAR